MGYTTDFAGEFIIDRPVDNDTAKLLKGLNQTRRMKRSIEGYGIEGEFYIDGEGFMEQDKDKTVVCYNTPPKTQPGLWCKWELQDDNQTIEWNGAEKFYFYTEWIEYLINSILKPRGYTVNGEVEWEGEEKGDIGIIIIKDNIVTTKLGSITYS